MNSFFLSILNMSLIAGGMVPILLLLRYFLRKAPKWISCLLWKLVGIRLICPFTIESAWSFIPSAEPIPQSITTQPIPQIQSGLPFLNAVVNPILSDHLTTDGIASANPTQIIVTIAAQIWILGVVILLLYCGISYYRLSRLVSPSIPMNGQSHVRWNDAIDSPFILGLFRPRIYLPTSLTLAQIEPILAHERAHIKRLDHLWKPIGYAILTIHWFNPLVWVAYFFLCRDIELACDERVIREMTPDERKRYSDVLLSCSIPRKRISACPLAFGEVGVKYRIQTVLNYRKPGFWVVVIGIAVCASVTVFFLTNPPKPDVIRNTERIRVSWSAEGENMCWLLSGAAPLEGYLAVIRIDDAQDLQDFYEATNSYFHLDQPQGGLSFQEAVQERTEDDFFADHSLILVYLPENSGSYRPEAYSVMDQNGTILLGYSHPSIPNGQAITDDMAGWIMMTEMPDQDLEGKRLLAKMVESDEQPSLPKNESVLASTWRDRTESPDLVMPTIALYEDGSFYFIYSLFSSEMCIGVYENTEGCLILHASGGKKYRFQYGTSSTGAPYIQFQENESDRLPKYHYAPEDEPLAPVPDGLCFYREYHSDDPESRYDQEGKDCTDLIALKPVSRITENSFEGIQLENKFSYLVDHITCDSNQNGIPETWNLLHGPFSGRKSYYLNVTEKGKLLCPRYLILDLEVNRFMETKEGQLYLQGAGGEYEIQIVDQQIHLMEK